MRNFFVTIFIHLVFLTSFGQIKDLVATEGISTDLHKANVGKISFMNGNIPLDQYKESDFLTTFNLTRKSDLNIRVFMNNSVTNYLHQLAPDFAVEELLQSGNLQFSFYIDGQFIY